MYRSFIACITLVNCSFAFGMNDALHASHDIRSLPLEVCKIILLSNEQWDGRIYFSLPDHVREYLCKRVRIRRLAQNFFEKTYVETKDNCRLM